MYEGRRFFVGFMQNEIKTRGIFVEELIISVSISTSKATKVRVRSPLFAGEYNWNLEANTVKTQFFNAGGEITQTGVPLNKLFEIISDEPVVVSAMNARATSSDAMAILPVSTWGKDYVIASMPCDSYEYSPELNPTETRVLYEMHWGTPRPGQFMIMSAEDGTRVEFTPSCNTSSGHSAGQTYSMVLDEGECVLLQALGGPNGVNDLSGTHVSADKNIGVISGHVRTSIPNWIKFPIINLEPQDTKDHLCEMLHPIRSWGREYVSVPFFGDIALGDHFRVYAAEPNTTISLSDGASTRSITIANKYGVADLALIDKPTVWTSDKPIMLVQHMYTSSAILRMTPDPWTHGIPYDPAMVVLPAREQFVSAINFQAPPTTNLTSYHVLVTVDMAGVSNVRLNGKLLIISNPELANQRIPGTDLFWASVDIDAEVQYILETEGRMAGVIYANGQHDSYAFPLGTSLIDLKNPDIDPPVISDDGSDYKCGRLRGWILDEGHDQAGIALIEINEEATFNFNWNIAPIEDSTRYVTFNANVVDQMLPGRIEYTVTDLSGNSTIYAYDYTPPSFEAPTGFVFDASAFGDRICQPYLLRNTGTEEMVIRRIAPSGDTRISTPDLPGFPIRLQPDETLEFSVCYTPNGEADKLSGRVFVEFDCQGRYWVDVEGFVEKPLIRSIGHNFGEVRVGDTVYANVKVVNPGNVPLVVNGFDCFPCPGVFRFPGNPFPFALAPDDTVEVRVCFSPDKTDFFRGDYEAANDRALENAFLITGTGIEPGILIQGVDWRERRVGTVNDSTVTISNDGSASIRLKDVAVVQPSAFSIDATAAIGLTLEPDQSVTLPVSFVPDQRQNYTQQIVVTTDWSVRPQVTAELRGVGTMPDIEPIDIDFGLVKVNDTRSLTRPLFRTGGNEDLTVDLMKFDDESQPYFAIDEARFFTAGRYGVGAQHVVDASFTPDSIGPFETLVRVVHDAAAAYRRDTTWVRLIGEGYRRDTIASDVIFDVTTELFACLDNSIKVRVHNPGNVPLEIEALEIETDVELDARWTDQPVAPLSLVPGEERDIAMSILPQRSGFFQMKIRVRAQNGYEAEFEQQVEVLRARLDISFDDQGNEGRHVYPGQEIPLKFGGTITGGPSVPFEFAMELRYNGSSLSPTINAGTLVLTDALNQEIVLPLMIEEEWGITRIYAAEKVDLALPAQWHAEVPFLAYLDPLPQPNMTVHVAETPCMAGSDELIEINLNEVCANLVRFITLVPRLSVTIAPNPASHEITLLYDAPEDQEVTISLTNVLGRSPVHKKKIFLKKGEHSYKLSCSDFPGGMYSVTIRSGTKVQQQSLIINR